MDNKVLAPVLLTMAFLAVSSTVVAASDWQEDRPAFRADVGRYDQPVPQPAPDRNAPPKQVAQGTFLTGSATRFGAGEPVVGPPPAVPPRAMMPLYSPGAQAQFGLDAGKFVMNARKDTVVPPAELKGWLDRTYPQFRLSAQNNPEAVIEVKGAWDKSSEILSAMGVRYREVKAKQLRELPLTATKVLVINCEGRIPEEAVEPIRQWVIRGGYLISTDWTLHSFVEQAFPNTIAWNGQNTDGDTVDAIMVGQDRSLLNGFDVQRATWKLDQESQMVKVLRPDVVRIIARSHLLTARTNARNYRLQPNPNLQGILACEFSYGRGKVLHLVGHYDYNGPATFTRHVLPDAVPGIGIGARQAIATNFLLQGLQR